MNRIKAQLIRHEGLRLKPYRCTASKLTIGIGRNHNDRDITHKESYVLMEYDINNRLVKLFPQVKYHPDELIKELDWLIANLKLFGDIFKQEGLTEIQRAARFMFLIIRSFSSKGDSFCTSQKRGTSSMYNRLQGIKEPHKRLNMAIIENLSYE